MLYPKIHIDHIRSKHIEEPDEYRLYYPDPNCGDYGNPDKYVGVITDEFVAYDMQKAYNETYGKGYDPAAMEKMEKGYKDILEILKTGSRISTLAARLTIERISREALEAAKIKVEGVTP